MHGSSRCAAPASWRGAVPALALATVILGLSWTAFGQSAAIGALQGTYFLHSGELEVAATDLDAGGRAGWNVVINRTYRSRTLGGTVFGQGWDSSILRRLRALPDGTVEYHDASGEIWDFSSASGGGYTAPVGLFLRLAKTDRGWMLIDQQWRITEFDEYGRLSSEADEFYDPTKPGSGNKIHYLYSSEGRLATIVDPNGRTTSVAYYAEGDTSPGAFAGYVKEISDWRGRQVTYLYDSAARLTEVRLPAVANTSGVPRPTIKYGYHPGATTYNDVLELGTNLVSITDPNEVATGGPPRLRITYGTSGNDRDKVLREDWGTGESATIAYSASGETTVTDVFGQVRKYTFVTPPNDRAHFGEVRELGVPVWSGAAFGQLPATLTPGTASTATTDRVWTFAYAGGVELSRKLAGVREVINTWKPAAGAPGLVLASSKTLPAASTSSSSVPLPAAIPIERTFTYQSGPNGSTFLQAIASNGHTVEAPEPHRYNTAPTATNSAITATSKFDSSGLPTGVESSGGTDAASAGARGKIEYYPADDAMLHRRSMPHVIRSGEAASELVTTIEYPSATQKRETDARGVTTTMDLDTWDRPVHVRIERPGDPLIVEQQFFYDATGRLVRTVEKKGSDTVETKVSFDVVGRRTAITTTGVAAPGGIIATSIAYDLPNRKIVRTEPGGAITTIDLDTLGRIRRNHTNTGSSPGASPVEQQFAYDLDGNRAYATDMFTASATAFDAHGRAIATRNPDGTLQTTVRDDWGNPQKVETFDTTGALAAQKAYGFTNDGRLQSLRTTVDTGIERQMDVAWDGGGRTTATATNGRASKTSYDGAGRLLTERAGAGDTSTLTQVFQETSVASHSGSLPVQTTTKEATGGSYAVSIERDASGNVRRHMAGALEWTQQFDELGNVTQRSVPNRPPTTFEVDARGAVKSQTLPDGSRQTFAHHPSGTQTTYTDPASTGGASEATTTDTDLLGRPLKRTYADLTFELIEWEGPRIKAVTDRQGRKQSFVYNVKGQLIEIRDGSGVTLDKLTYDAAGRLTSWVTADAELRWENFDLDGNPKSTTQVRFKDHSGQSSSPVILDQYVQEHRWDEHGERTHWSMPAYAGLMFGSGWAKWVREQHDAMGNLVLLGKVDDPAAPTAAALMSAQYRNAGRPDERVVFAGMGPTTSGVPIARTYGYDATTGLMNKLSVAVNGRTIAGAEVGYDGLQKADARLLGLSGGQRFTKWRYDARSRLTASVYGADDPGADPRLLMRGRAKEQLTPADFRTAQERVSQFDPATLSVLNDPAKPIDTSRIDPPTMSISEKPGGGHKIGEVTKGPRVYPFGYSGAEVVCDGRFSYTFDAKGRLVTATERTLGSTKRRVVYAYSGTGRLVGRRAEYTTTGTPDPAGCGTAAAAATTWTLENRAEILAADGLPADTTFIWDAISDRLITIARAGATASDPHGGLLKQIIHGGQSYDDPIETATVDPFAPTTVNYLYPVYDEAGAGSLQVVLNKTGEVVARNLPIDPFGGENVELAGAAIDRVAVRAKKDSSGALTEVAFEIRSTDAIASPSLASGVRLAALDAGGAILRLATAAPTLADPNTARWMLTGSEWTTLTDGATALSIAVTANLRAESWGADLPVLPAPEWAKATRTVTASPELPVDVHESLSSLSSSFAGIANNEESTTVLYEIENLALAATGGNGAVIEDVLTARLHAHPFTDPLTGLDYVRARWYQPLSGSWVSPDPKGYVDSSNLYAFAGGDPINGRDPTGEGLPATPLPAPPPPAWTPIVITGGAGAAKTGTATGGTALVEYIPPVALGTAIAAALITPFKITAMAEEDAAYEAEARALQVEIENAARKRRQQREAPTGVPSAEPAEGMSTDPCEEYVISGSKDSHVNGAIAEDKGWKWALANGHIGILPPSKVTAPGPDYITYQPIEKMIYVWDAKYRREGGRYPCSGPSPDKITSWMPRIKEAIERLSDPGLRAEVFKALKQGRIQGRLFKWPA